MPLRIGCTTLSICMDALGDVAPGEGCGGGAGEDEDVYGSDGDEVRRGMVWYGIL